MLINSLPTASMWGLIILLAVVAMAGLIYFAIGVIVLKVFFPEDDDG